MGKVVCGAETSFGMDKPGTPVVKGICGEKVYPETVAAFKVSSIEKYSLPSKNLL